MGSMAEALGISSIFVQNNLVLVHGDHIVHGADTTIANGSLFERTGECIEQQCGWNDEWQRNAAISFARNFASGGDCTVR